MLFQYFISIYINTYIVNKNYKLICVKTLHLKNFILWDNLGIKSHNYYYSLYYYLILSALTLLCHIFLHFSCNSLKETKPSSSRKCPPSSTIRLILLKLVITFQFLYKIHVHHLLKRDRESVSPFS